MRWWTLPDCKSGPDGRWRFESFLQQMKMKWYKIWANHGGGHMGYSERYEQHSSDENAHYSMRNWVDENFNNAIGYWKPVKKPPKQWIERQIQRVQNCLKELPKTKKELQTELEKFKQLLEK